MSDQRTDFELLTATRAGDGQAFAAFYRRHLPRAVAVLLRETGDRETTADLAAEVFAAALVSAGRFRAGPRRFASRCSPMSIGEPKYGEGATHSARLLLSCPDGPGIVSAVGNFLYENGANIVTSAQYSTHPEAGTFFMRVAFFKENLSAERATFEAAVAELARRFEMDWRITYAGDPKKAILMASHEDHCLSDLLWRHRRGELDMDVIGVISNHDDHRRDVEMLGIPYHHVAVTRDTKPQAEAEILGLIDNRADVVVLARYMQILSGDFLRKVGCPVINIHHSFLPAFAGAGPYQRAYERGVKLIGATAHYVTEELDAGPIIDQDVQRVAHDYSIEDLVRVGRDVERITLARALRSHINDRVLVHDGRTIVF
jgi:formyltetrahydrofolate deformylase